MPEAFMERCLQLARGGAEFVRPNPMVGCVITQHNRMVAEGWHRIFGGPHAEPDALSKLPADISPETLTLYVNLEPCSHHGKTPPCADTIIASGIRKVVIGAEDPNPLVAGSGILKLKEAGIEVISGVLKEECIRFNKVFYVNQLFKRPYIILKWAETADGYTAAKSFDPTRKIISGYESHILAHQLRAKADALICGAQTIRDDDPELTTRLWPGKNPDVYIFSPSGKIPMNSKIFKQKERSIKIITQHSLTELSNYTLKYNTSESIAPELIRVMQANKPLSCLLVEGGSKLHQEFIDAKLYDEIICIRSKQKMMGAGIKAPNTASLVKYKTENEEDIIYTYERFE